MGVRIFLSTLPARGATGPYVLWHDCIFISIHAPREGSDPSKTYPAARLRSFLSTLPARGATRGPGRSCRARQKFLSTLPARGATLQHLGLIRRFIISIHAPREGSDSGTGPSYTAHHHFYPRSPRGERHAHLFFICASFEFLSTLPARGATARARRTARPAPNFYPRSPRGERRLFALSGGVNLGYFYPRSPRGERPGTGPSYTAHHHFYPRSPRGERPVTSCLPRLSQLFLSTLPARGATQQGFGLVVGNVISIHAPREGSDLRDGARKSQNGDFYPRSPRGERHASGRYIFTGIQFLSTLPARGAT